MKRILIGLLLIILGTSYVIQRQQIIEYIASLSSEKQQQTIIVEVTEKPKKAKQEVELLAYPPAAR